MNKNNGANVQSPLHARIPSDPVTMLNIRVVILIS